ERQKRGIKKSVLVIGGGIAGIFSSLYLAMSGIKTYLVEKEPSIGGNMAKLDKTFPTLDCAMCVLSPKMVELKNNENIELLTNSEVIEIDGHVGNFIVRIRRKPRYIDEDKCVSCGNCSNICPVRVPDEFNQNLSFRKAIYIPFPQAVPNSYIIDRDNCLYFKTGACGLCEKGCENNAINFNQREKIIEIEVGAIILATGFRIFDAEKKKEYGYKRYRNVITNLDLERILNSDGPTNGELKRISDGKIPRSLAFIQCVGSRDNRFNRYCSSICCMISIKQALMIKEKYPEIDIYIYYNDIRASGREYEEFYLRAREKGIIFLRGLPSELSRDENENLRIISEDMNSGEIIENEVEMVVLASAMEPNNIDLIANQLHLSYGSDGFIMEAHPKLRPVETNIAGIFVAGCAQFPKSISETVSQAGNAAVATINLLTQGEIWMEEITSFVDRERCSGCGFCVEVCPYDAIKLNKRDKKAEVIEILCKGCGACVVACPSGAIQQRHFLDSQILSQINTIVER
ncbi:MAG: disulfide reductase, partial [Candidatus Altiarchaeales archaeon]